MVDHHDTSHHAYALAHGHEHAVGPDGHADGVQEPGEIADDNGNGYVEGTFVHKNECYGPDCTQTHGANRHHRTGRDSICVDEDCFGPYTDGAVWVDDVCYGKDCPYSDSHIDEFSAFLAH